MSNTATMKDLSQILKLLKMSKYLEYSIVDNSISGMKMLKNGNIVCENLIQEWMTNKESVDRTYVAESINTSKFLESHSFIKSKDFIINVYKTKEASFLHSPLVIKQQINFTGTLFNSDNSTKFCISQQQTRLISDYFFNCFCGLEKFYYIQRLRKIWWMIHLSNPSCLYIDSCDDKYDCDGTQIVKIKSMLPFKNIDVEHLSYVSSKDTDLRNHKLCPVDENSEKNISVIRSVINLEYAACALLLDACTNVRNETMFLHNKLVPYQCAVIAFCDEINIIKLEDLCSHISDVIHNGGIKVFAQKWTKKTLCRLKLESKLKTFDQIGIPYVIILEDRSLENGLLKLRSRDTLLQETIHISDLPGYVKQMLN